MQKALELIQSVFDWLKTVGPSALSVGMIVYNLINRKLTLLRLEVGKLTLREKYRENEKSVEEANKNKSDLDIVNDAISEGRKLDDANNSGTGTKQKGDDK